MRCIGFVSSIVLAACADPAKIERSPGDPTAADTAPGGVDSADPADTGETSGTAEPAPESVCGPWSGVAAAGTRWTYQSTAAVEAEYGYHRELAVSVESIDGEEVVIRSVQASEAATYSSSSDTLTTYRCTAEGMLFVSSATTSAWSDSANTYETEFTQTCAEPVLVLPAALTVDSAWNQGWDCEAVYNGQASRSAYVLSCVVEDEDPLTVPAGEFKSLEYACEGDIGLGTISDRAWVASGVGEIEDDTMELVTYEP